MYYDYTYRGKIPPRKWNTPKHLRYKNGRLGGKNPEFVRVYTGLLPKGWYRDSPEHEYFLIRDAHLLQVDPYLRHAAKEGASHQELVQLYETWKKNQDHGPLG
tara:strand:- start:1642 stop:1950 length:309 start_codon:yes stop_codon:yes gene_type:complete